MIEIFTHNNIVSVSPRQAIVSGAEIHDLTSERVREIERAMQDLNAIRQKTIDSVATSLSQVQYVKFKSQGK